jgi:hypothetical protein
MIAALLALAPLAQNSSPVRPVLVGLDGAEHGVALAQLDTRDPREQQAWRVRFEGGRAPAVPREAGEFRLWSGERLRGAVKGGKQEALVVQTSGGVGLLVDLDEIDSLRFPARIPDLWARPLEPAAEGDRLYRRAREALDVLEGGVEGFGDDGIAFHDQRVGQKQIPWSEVAGLFLDRASGKQAPARKIEGVPVTLDLADGGRLRGGLVHLSAAGAELKRAHDAALLLPLDALLLLTVEDPRLCYLSDLAPAVAGVAAPFGDDLGMTWPPCVDGSVGGGPLAAGGKRFARGIGVHAPSASRWKLGGEWHELHGLIAVDDGSTALAAHGSVVFRVLVDGKPAFESEVLHGGDGPRALPKIDLTGAKELALEVTDAGDGFAGDRADWLELTLLR